jgi:hypothetical protein
MAIVMKDGERLYLRAWEYNAARIITELANIVKNHGGRVKPTNTAIISDRSAEEKSEPITVTHTTYISFILDETYYYYQVDGNPFFEFYYNKTPIKNGKRSRAARVIPAIICRLSSLITPVKYDIMLLAPPL